MVKTYSGKTLSEWSLITGYSRRILAYRIAKGWSIKRATTEKPVNGNNQYMRA